MTVDERLREAAAAVHVAVARGDPRPVPRRRRGVRGFFAVVLAVLTPAAGISVVNATRDDSTTTPRIVGGVKQPDVTKGRVDAVITTPSAPSRAAAPDRGVRRASPIGALPPESLANESDVHDKCSPEIVDPKGDINNPAVDILEGSMRYDAAANVIHIHEVFDDIPSPVTAADILFYFFEFNLDGTTYYVLAHHDPSTYGEWSFSVQRYDRRDDPPVTRTRIASVTGTVDGVRDVVDLSFSVDEFNRGEREQSQAEGMAPAAGPLERGDTLTRLGMTAYPRAAGPGPYDSAQGCNFILE